MHHVHRPKLAASDLISRMSCFGHDTVRPETIPTLRTLIEPRNGDLVRKRDTRPPQRAAHAVFIDGFKQTRARVRR